MAGQPTKYKAQYHPDLLVSMLSRGDPAIAFMAHENIAKQTFYSWLDDHEEFKDAYQRGLVKAEIYWTQVGKDNLENPDFNHNAHAFLMGSRFGVGKTRKMRANVIAPEDKNISISDRLSSTITSFGDSEVSQEELDKVASSFSKIADIEERTDLAKRVEEISAQLKKTDGKD